jgi:hypothetical protein
MKAAHLIVVGLMLATAGTLFAQTKLVAHRSHSGRAETFTSSGVDNFGGPPPEDPTASRIVTRVVRLNDSLAVEYSNSGTDTTLHHPFWNNPKIGVDSLRKAFPSISFEGYKEPVKTSKRRSRTPSDRRNSELHDPAAASRRNGMLPLALLTGGLGVAVGAGIYSTRKGGGRT